MYDPGLHLSQPPDTGAVLKVPLMHWTHDDAPGITNLPALQVLHVDADVASSAVEYLPAEQTTQSLAS